MSQTTRTPPAIGIAWQATEPAPRGWRQWLVGLLEGYLAALGHPGSGVTLLVANDAALRHLNATHRRRDRPTDILSFSYLPEPSPASRPRSKRGASPALVGELAVSWNRVKVQARANGWEPRTEMARLLAHGCVHLMGYDHATRAEDAVMRRIEERLLVQAGFPGLYPPKARERSRRPKTSSR
jgi:probable rRNA maturation factor